MLLPSAYLDRLQDIVLWAKEMGYFGDGIKSHRDTTFLHKATEHSIWWWPICQPLKMHKNRSGEQEQHFQKHTNFDGSGHEEGWQQICLAVMIKLAWWKPCEQSAVTKSSQDMNRELLHIPKRKRSCTLGHIKGKVRSLISSANLAPKLCLPSQRCWDVINYLGELKLRLKNLTMACCCHQSGKL